MSSSSEAEPTGIAHRLREVDRHARAMLDHLDWEPPVDVPVSPVLVPVPRRARAFLFRGPGGGSFAEVTLTAPRRSATGG